MVSPTSRPSANYKGDPTTYTTQDCIDNRWSGLRVNLLNGRTEIWALGKMLVDGNTQQLAGNPGLLANMYEEAFATWGTVVEVDAPVVGGVAQPREIKKGRKPL